MSTMTFDELESALQACQATLSAAEAHGALCGVLAVRGQWRAQAWMADILPQMADAPEQTLAREHMTLVFHETQNALSRDQMEFAPLLPDDEAPLASRVAALTDWCGGFLHGLGTGGLSPQAEMPEEVLEVMRDLAEIGQAMVGPGESEAENEDAYIELVEYLRAAAQLVYDLLADQRVHRGDP